MNFYIKITFFISVILSPTIYAQTFDPLSTHILDTSTGIPGAGVLVKLYRKEPHGPNWVFIADQLTATNGRIGNIISPSDYVVGTYKFWFNTAELYGRTNTPTFYPFVEVLFDVTDPTEHLHIPILLSPFGYSSYKGSFTAAVSPPPPPVADPLWAFLLDTTTGIPAGNVPCSLYILKNNGHWNLIVKKNTTNDTGLFKEVFTDSCDFVLGTYKLSFETQDYWNSKGYDSIFPTLDVVFKVDTISAGRYTVPILISPYAFTTYKGNSAPNPVPCNNLP